MFMFDDLWKVLGLTNFGSVFRFSENQIPVDMEAKMTIIECSVPLSENQIPNFCSNPCRSY